MVPIEMGLAGNTKAKPSADKRVSPSIRWIFTLHNYNESDIKTFNKTFNKSGSNGSKFIIFAEETGSNDETPHLQGYIEFSKKIRPIGAFENNKISWRKAKKSREINIEYIKKEGGNVYLNGKKMRYPKVLKSDQLYEWQKKIIDICDTDPDDRSIYWIFEKKGNSGKTSLCKYIVKNYNALVLSNSAKDMKNGIIGYHKSTGWYPDIVIINIPRSVNQEFLSYTGIEEIKDGLFYSPKYEGGMVHMASPHVFIFSNEKPDTDMLSADRWKIIKVK